MSHDMILLNMARVKDRRDRRNVWKLKYVHEIALSRPCLDSFIAAKAVEPIEQFQHCSRNLSGQ